MKKITIILFIILFISTPAKNLVAKNKGFFSAEVGVKYNIMLNNRAKKQWLDWYFISSKSTDNFSCFGKLYFTYFAKKNKLSFYSGLCLQSSPITYKRYYEGYTITPRDIKKDVTNFFEILMIQGVAYQIKKIRIGVEFGYPVFVRDFKYSRLHSKDKDKYGPNESKWFHPNFYTNVFVTQEVKLRKYKFYIKESVEYHLINDFNQDQKRHVMSLIFGIQLPLTKKRNNEI